MKAIRICLAAALLLLCSCGKNGKDEPAPLKIANITVMSFNIRSSTITSDTEDRSWDKRKYAVRNMVEEIKPDVMGMQEATNAQRADLRSLLTGYDLFEVPNTGTSKGGNAILMYNTAVLEVLQCKSFYLSSTPDKPSVNGWNEETQYRTTIWAEFKHKESGQRFFVANTHMPLGSEERDNTARINSANLNISRMKSAAGEDAVVFIIGDMNCSYATGDSRRKCLQPYYDWMSSARDKAVKTDATLSYNGWGSSSSSNNNLDHIFYRNAIASEFRTISGHNYGVEYISDHYPIICYATIL
ncbi:MAG: endonuclease/exonuclease/phosphatase family protein [Bacteroidales bacterium]|nr:endonuclease/exonuclease/phosphatase family protein [Bacteroidales bacterium]